MHEQSLQVTPSVETSQNFKSFFIEHDAIQNVINDIAFSVLPKYLCKAGCKMCYLRDMWESLPDNVHLTDEQERVVVDRFKWFDQICTVDDLYMLKHEYPKLYDFYLRHSDKMYITSMTDIAFIQQGPLVVNELNFIGVYEVSFSDAFLAKKNGLLIDNIIAKLEEMHAIAPIGKVKTVITTVDGHKSEQITKLVEWAHSHDIFVGMHHDISAVSQRKMEIDVVDYQELNFYAQNSEPMMVLSETLHIQGDRIFSTLVDATKNMHPFFTFTDTSTVRELLVAVVQSKLDTYARFSAVMENRCDNKLLDYFIYVSTSVVAHKDYNFVPRLFLPLWKSIAKALVAEGWIETKVGLIAPEAMLATNPVFIPLLSFTQKPRQKLHHIAIKNVPTFA